LAGDAKGATATPKKYFSPMSANNKSVALNLGMQNVSLAEFEILPNGGLSLSAYQSNELSPDPADDIARVGAIGEAVGALRQSLQVKGGVTGQHCLPSQAVFTRFVRLPGSSPEDIKAVISFEAQQNVPFPINEVVWDYQILGGEREGTWDVALAAIKSDQLSEVYDSCVNGGVKADHIDIAPMALANAFRFNYSDYAGTTLLVDMGARTTNLVFVDGEKVFSRTIPIGGNAITVAIAKELGCEAVEAERMKKEKGFVGLGGGYAEDPDPTVAKIAKVARNTMTRLHAEITRSISFYRANQGGTAPVRALLCGGAMSMGSMREFFSEKLQMPLEWFNPLRNVCVSSPQVAAAVEGRIHTLGELVGLALRAGEKCPVEINLRPVRARTELELKKRKPALIAALVCLVFALLSLHLFFSSAGEKLVSVTEGEQSDIKRLKGISSQIQQSRDERQRLQDLAAPILLSIEERRVWLALLDTLGKSLPPRYIWTTQITPLSNGAAVSLEPTSVIAPPQPKPTPARKPTPQPKSDKKAKDKGKDAAKEKAKNVPPPPGIDAIRIDGLYLENPSMTGANVAVVDAFVDSLAKSGFFVIDSTVKTSMVRTQPDNTSWAYGYSFVVPLKYPIALP